MTARQVRDVTLIVGVNLALAVLYYASACWGLSLSAGIAEQVTTIWPPTGIALAAVMVFGYQTLPGVLLGAFVVNVTTHETYLVAAGIALGNTLEALAGAWLLQRLSFRMSLARLRDVMGVVFLAAGLSTTISATIGVACLCLGGIQPWVRFQELWLLWWLGDAAGNLVVAPFLMTWAVEIRRNRWPTRIIESAGLLLTLVLISLLVFGLMEGRPSRYPLVYVIMPVIIWAALRRGPAVTSLVVAVAAYSAVLGTQKGLGPFSGTNVRESLVLLQTFMAVTAVTAMVVAATTTERRRAELRLRRSQRDLADFVENATVGLHWVGPDGAILWANRAELEILGYRRDEYVGHRLAEFHVDPNLIETMLRRLIGGEELVEFEARLRCKDGTIRDVVVNASGLWKHGRFIHSRGFTTDVTQRKRAETTMRFLAEASQTLVASLEYETTVASVARLIVPAFADWCAIDVLNDDGELEQVAVVHTDAAKVERVKEFRKRFPPRMESQIGVPQVLRTGRPEVYSVISEHWLEHSEMADEQRRLVQELSIRSALVVPLLARGRTLGAITLVTSESPHRYTEADLPLMEELARYCALAVDNAKLYRAAQLEIVERKRTELALRETDERLRFTLKAAHVGTWAWNMRSGEVQWSDNLEAVHGRRPGAFSSTFESFLEDVHPDDRQKIDEAIKKALEGTGEYFVEYRCVQEDGSVLWIEGKGRVTYDGQGQPTGMAGVCADITQRKRVADELRHAKEAAEAASRVKTEFLANVSHELRTPMNAIIGMTELALEEALSPAVKEQLEIAKESANVLLRLLNDLLDVSKIESGKFQLESIPFSLREALDESIRTLSVRAGEKGLKLACEVADDVADALVGDPIRLQQIMYNLVGNGIKFTEQGGVTVRVTCDDSDTPEARLRFSVSDTGIGISREDQDRIFAPFTQVDPSTTRKFGGTGLGLTIVAQLISMMGGRIQVRSEPGHGSEFYFSACFALQMHDTRPRPLAHTLPSELRGLRVLVADDNPTNRRILEQALTELAARPELVDDGRTAMSRLKAAAEAGESFGLVILDAAMPGLDGLAVVEQMQSELRLSSATIVMLSSTERDAFADRLDRLHISALLEKPVTRANLLEAIVAAMKSGAPSAAPLDGTAPARPARSVRVLLAEDTPANQKLVVSALTKRGHRVVVADNGYDALRFYQAEPFDLILMDVQMAGLDGLQATAQIRAWEKDSHDRIPIVAMTAHAMPGDRERCLDAGMDAYLPKPINLRTLVEMVTNLGAGRNRAEQAEPPAEGTVADSAAPPFDAQDSLQRMANDVNLFYEMIDFFLEDAPPLVDRLQTALDEGNAEGLERAGHSLKGLAANVGAGAAREVAGRLEEAGRVADLQGAAPLIERLRREMDRLIQALVAYRSQAPTTEAVRTPAGQS